MSDSDEGLLSRGAEHLFHAKKIADDEVKLVDLEQQEVEGIEAALQERTPGTLPGVDVAALQKLDAEFDVENVRTIARECFYGVREARTRQDASESSPLLSPKMEDEMASLIVGDVTAHRHHVMPFLELIEAQIASAEISEGKEEIDVDFTVSAADGDIDDTTKQVLGDSSVHRWKERWHFEREPSLDTSAVDRDHWEDWMVAHRGWVVTAMTRLGDALPQPPR